MLGFSLVYNLFSFEFVFTLTLSLTYIHTFTEIIHHLYSVYTKCTHVDIVTVNIYLSLFSCPVYVCCVGRICVALLLGLGHPRRGMLYRVHYCLTIVADSINKIR